MAHSGCGGRDANGHTAEEVVVSPTFHITTYFTHFREQFFYFLSSGSMLCYDIVMSERPKPYVGISGVTSPEQQHHYEQVFHEVGLRDEGRRLAIGVKAVHKTQYLDINNKYGPAWYPVGEAAFQSAATESTNAQESINVAQAYLDVAHVGDPKYRQDFTERIFRRGRPWIDGIQFDMLPWHSDAGITSFLHDVKQSHPDKLTLLQCHGAAMEELGAKKAIQSLGTVATAIDYVLFDASHGTGRRLDVARLRPFLDEASSSSALVSVGLAVAGGLNAQVVREDLPEILDEFPQVSWDAEGQLHSIDSHGERPLDEQIVSGYLAASRDVLRNAS
jgi:hypothetical protein